MWPRPVGPIPQQGALMSCCMATSCLPASSPRKQREGTAAAADFVHDARSSQRNRLSFVKGATPATLAFGYVPSEGDVMDAMILAQNLLEIKLISVKQKAAIAFHKANHKILHYELLLYIVHGSRMMSCWLATGFSIGLRPTNLILFAGVDLLWSLLSRPPWIEPQQFTGWLMEVLWCVQHANSFGTRPFLNAMNGKHSLEQKTSLDLASRAQTPDDVPSLGGGSSIHTSDGQVSPRAATWTSSSAFNS